MKVPLTSLLHNLDLKLHLPYIFLVPSVAIRPMVRSGDVSPLLLDNSVSILESALDPVGGFGNSCDNAAAGHRWTSLLQLHPESTRELLFRLPWYNSDLSTESSLHPPYTSEGRPSSWILKVVCKSVPLDMTWSEIASSLNASTPITMGNSYFTA